MNLNGKTYIVTGGASGTGHATAKALTAIGARVVIWGRTEAALAAAVEAGVAAAYQVAELADPVQVEAVFRAFDARHGGLDGLIHAAGIWTGGALTDCDPETVVRHIGAVTLSATLCVQGAARRLIERGGRLAVVAAASAKSGFVDTALNTLAKRALDGLHEGLVRELRGKGCFLTTVYPDSIAPSNSEAVRSGDAMSYDDLAAAILYAITAPGTVHIQEIVLTAPNTGRR